VEIPPRSKQATTPTLHRYGLQGKAVQGKGGPCISMSAPIPTAWLAQIGGSD